MNSGMLWSSSIVDAYLISKDELSLFVSFNKFGEVSDRLLKVCGGTCLK